MIQYLLLNLLSIIRMLFDFFISPIFYPTIIIKRMDEIFVDAQELRESPKLFFLPVFLFAALNYISDKY